MPTSELRRSWSGLELALVATRAAATRTLPSRDHRLVCREGGAGGAADRAADRAAGRAAGRDDDPADPHRPRRGPIDLIPAGIPGIPDIAGLPGLPDSCDSWDDDPASTVLQVSVSPDLLAVAAARAGLAPEARIELAPQRGLHDPELEHLLRAFEAELRAEPPEHSLYGDSLAMAVAAHLLRRYRVAPAEPGARAARDPEGPRAGGLSPRQLRRVTEHVEAHVDQRLALAELAKVAGVSASHLKALFKRSTGLPVHQYVMRRRVERARLLLVARPATIADVAAQTGFANQSHLARWMRRIAGVTPAEVRAGATAAAAPARTCPAEDDRSRRP